MRVEITGEPAERIRALALDLGWPVARVVEYAVMGWRPESMSLWRGEAGDDSRRVAMLERLCQEAADRLDNRRRCDSLPPVGSPRSESESRPGHKAKQASESIVVDNSASEQE